MRGDPLIGGGEGMGVRVTAEILAQLPEDLREEYRWARAEYQKDMSRYGAPSIGTLVLWREVKSKIERYLRKDGEE